MKPKPDNIPPRSTILVVTHYFAAHGGGIERVAEKLLEELAVGSRFAFAWAASNTEPQPTKGNPEILPMRATNFVERFLGFPWPIWSPGSLKKLKQKVEAADLVWLHDTLYLGNILAFRWAKKMGKPVVITQHVGPIPYRNPILRLLMVTADRIFLRPMLKGADQTVFISDRIAEHYYQKIPFTRPIQIIPNGVEVRLYHAPSPEKRAWLRQQFALRADQPVLLFVGRFVAKKGLAVVRELAKLLPEWRFWLAGRGPICPEKWHLPNIHVFCDRSGATLSELYQAADMLILPSYGEGFPLVIQEALASGLPALCSPETAAGSRVAVPHLLQADVWPSNPSRTAAVWAGVLRGRTAEMPRTTPDDYLAAFASSTWAWPAIAAAYAEIFRTLLRKNP